MLKNIFKPQAQREMDESRRRIVEELKNRPASPEIISEAMQNPNGWVYLINGDYGPHETIPPAAIAGRWKVDERGKLTDEFKENPKFDPTI